MGKAYKNFWSLNTDEAVVAGILRDETPRNVEVLMPLNAQMKDIDLILADVKKGKIATIQVKGSRAYEPRKSELKEHGHGSAGWFFFPRRVIQKSTADYFIFLIYIIEQSRNTGRRSIEFHTITIPTNKLKTMAKKYKTTHGNNRYSFLIWINPRTKKAFDIRDKRFDLGSFLDKKGFQKVNRRF